ncbi:MULTISPECIES: hypothetical protein [Hyphobacterium]|uniref:Type II secretion system protein GspC N-terminal domain-containing protein n=1 Tax=Hyphobacterium vulgare TaxID=1736751 RepID=A0ABV6ZV90_9PROT
MNRRLLILLGVAVILGGVYAATQLGGPGNTVRAVAPGGLPVQPGVVRTPPIAHEEGPFLPPLSSFQAIESRPLFRADRRRPAEVIEQPVQTPVQTPVTNDGPPDLIVVSVVTGPNGRSAATVRQTGETRRVYTGDTVDGWRIDAIRPDGVEISRDRERWALPVGEPEE